MRLVVFLPAKLAAAQQPISNSKIFPFGVASRYIKQSSKSPDLLQSGAWLCLR
jgi:hypothetical protein